MTLRSQTCCLTLRLLLCGGILWADEPHSPRPAELVGGDAGLVIEVRQPQRVWDTFQQEELYRRWEQTGLFREMLASAPFQRWQEVDRTVTEATGVPLTQQVFELCAQDLVLALYLPPEGEPQGVLITRAASPAAVQRFIETGHTLDPEVATQNHDHLGEPYFSRLTSGPRQTRLFFVTFHDVFALSDHESRIQQVIELRKAGRTPAPDAEASKRRLIDQAAYQQTALPANQPASQARVVMIAKPWERVWQESADDDAGSAWLRRIWPALQAVTVDVRTEDGLHLEGQLHLHADQTDARWQAWTASTPSPQAFLAAIPPQAVFVAAGGIHFQPLWETARELASDSEREGWKRGRRLLRGFLGGRDLLNDVLPALCHDVGLYVVPTDEPHAGIAFDGVLQCRFPPQPATEGLHLVLDQALSSGLTLICAQANEAQDDDTEPTTVHSAVAEKKIVRWLVSPLPIQVAYQITPEGLTVSRSITTLRRHLDTDAAQPASPAQPSRFITAREQWFANAGQMFCLDVARLRGPSSPSADTPADASPTNWQTDLLTVCDVAYVATQMEVSRLTIRLGLSTDPPR